MKTFVLLGLMIIASILMNGCSELIPKASPLPSFYILTGTSVENTQEINKPPNTPASQPMQTNIESVAATLTVNSSTATAGFNSARMVYSRVPYKLEFFAHSEWIDTPARMLTPLIVNTLKAKGIFSAVTLAPSTVETSYLLDTQIIRLQQEFFSPQSRERLTVRATLIDNVKHTVIFMHELDFAVTAKSENPYGGVIAANEATQILLDQLAVLCSEALIN